MHAINVDMASLAPIEQSVLAMSVNRVRMGNFIIFAAWPAKNNASRAFVRKCILDLFIGCLCLRFRNGLNETVQHQHDCAKTHTTDKFPLVQVLLIIFLNIGIGVCVFSYTYYRTRRTQAPPDVIWEDTPEHRDHGLILVNVWAVAIGTAVYPEHNTKRSE